MSAHVTANHHRHGVLLVATSALLWSFGGTIARYINCTDSWAVVFWRSFYAALFLLLVMLWREGWRGTIALFKNMGWPGYTVALSFAISTSSFVISLSYTTVANVLLIQATVPLLAALIGWLVFRDRVSGLTWAAIAMVILGVGIMVSDSFSGKVSPIGDGLAVFIAVAFAIATVITRHHAEVRMIPAVCLGVIMAGCLASFMAKSLIVSPHDMFWLILFGSVNLGAGLAFFVAGARLIPASLAALLGTLETVLGPIWVWLIHGELPSRNTIIGGSLVLFALLAYLLYDFYQQSRQRSRTSESGSAFD